MARQVGILMVCLGNICRSPTAEGVLRAHLQQAGLEARMRVDSAGTSGAHAGRPPDARAIACANGHGVDIAAQRARRLLAEDFEAFDVILCADRSVLDEVRQRQPQAAPAQVALLLDWAGVGKQDVPDPYYGDAGDFEHAYALLDAAAQGIVERLRRNRF